MIDQYPQQSKEKKNPPKVGEEKKRGKRSPNFTRKAQKCNKRLMYKENGQGSGAWFP